jgi:hypothetical protein
VAVVLLAALPALAQYEISWHTIDGGGVMNSTDGQPNGFELSGTIGQPDAQSPPVMFGGTFELTGGFWPITLVCSCPGDLNGDGKRNGSDVQLFVACLLAGSGNCVCADADVMNGLSVADVPVFVGQLLTTTACP